MKPLDYDNCRIMRCFKKKDTSDYIDVPIAGGTNAKTRTAILKLASAFAKRDNYSPRCTLDKYDYYILIRKEKGVVSNDYQRPLTETRDFDGHTTYGEPLRFSHYGGDRNPKHMCYFNELLECVRTDDCHSI